MVGSAILHPHHQQHQVMLNMTDTLCLGSIRIVNVIGTVFVYGIWLVKALSMLFISTINVGVCHPIPYTFNSLNVSRISISHRNFNDII